MAQYQWSVNMARRGHRPQRKRVFVGCEGQSEVNYTGYLSRLIGNQRKDRFLDRVDLGGGDPLAILERAIEKMHQRERNHGLYWHRMLFLDTDRIGANPLRDQKFFALTQQSSIALINQEPCFEGLLLRHLPNCHNLRPQTSLAALHAVLAQWPEYEKPASASDISRKITAASLASARLLEPQLDAFLQKMGLI